MKFGGTSLAGGEGIKNTASIIKTRLDKKPIIVISAMKGVTDKLLNLAKISAEGVNPNEKTHSLIEEHKETIKSLNLTEDFLTEDFVNLHDVLNGIYLLKELSLRSLDLVSSFGEIFSSKIISEYLNKNNIKSKQYSGGEIGILMNNIQNSEVSEETYENVRNTLKGVDDLPIITGFIAKNKEGDITTLGRGGSDYTASIIGAALNVDEIEIWTDVDGIKTADPKIVENAKQWSKITFNEAAEMAYFGAKILHPKTLKPAVKKQIPVRILNTQNIDNKGTLIVKEDEDHPFKSISYKKNITIVRLCSTKMLLVHGFLSKVFDIFNKYEISIDLVSTSEITVSMTIDNFNNGFDNLDLAISELEKIAKVELLRERDLICIVGKGIRGKSGILGRIFKVCKNSNTNVEMVSQGASPISISFVVKQEDSNEVIKKLHQELFESGS
tara:strand:+ start:2106 stop:3431 length:1326 start_codon:yes stop_codon:yes gene_type:complete